MFALTPFTWRYPVGDTVYQLWPFNRAVTVRKKHVKLCAMPRAKRVSNLKSSVDSRYFVDAAAKALDVLESFEYPEEELTIAEIARRLELPRASAFRLLYTLEHRGYVTRPHGKKYQRTPARKRFRLGYAAQNDRCRIKDGVTHSMIRAAEAHGIDLIVKDNELSASKAVANVQALIDERVHLVVEYQPNEIVGHIIANKCHAAKIPLVAISYAHPGAYYVGANDYESGRLAGVFLCEYVLSKWRGNLDTLLLFPHSLWPTSTHEVRTAGTCEAFRELMGSSCKTEIVKLQPGCSARDSYRETKAFLQQYRGSLRNIFIAAVSDQLAIGAARAVMNMNLSNRVLVVAQGGSHEARNWIRRGTPLRAAVAHWPELFAERVIPLALKILDRKDVPLATYTDLVVLTRENLHRYYPEEHHS